MSEACKRDKHFSVGDLVRVRDWDDMAEEFGIVGDVIQCDAGFLPSMRYLCGKEFTICNPQDLDGIDSGITNYAHGVEGFKKWLIDDEWIITEDMIEHVDEEDMCDDMDCVEDITGILSSGGVA